MAAACIDQLLAETRSGDKIQVLRTMQRMKTLDVTLDYSIRSRAGDNGGQSEHGPGGIGATIEQLLRDEIALAPTVPELRQALALSNVQAGRYAEAERAARLGLETTPSHAPLWSALALALAGQGKKDGAVAAFVLAHDWARDSPAMLNAYRQAAATPPLPTVPTLGDAYREAVEFIVEQNAKRAALLATMTEIKHSDGIVDKAFAMPGLDFNQCAMPVWPKASLRREESGKTTLLFALDVDGKLLLAGIAVSSGHAELDNAALLGALSCQGIAAKKDGKPIRAVGRIQYVWELEP